MESESSKLSLTGFRPFGEFHESCVDRIANDPVALEKEVVPYYGVGPS